MSLKEYIKNWFTYFLYKADNFPLLTSSWQNLSCELIVKIYPMEEKSTKILYSTLKVWEPQDLGVCCIDAMAITKVKSRCSLQKTLSYLQHCRLSVQPQCLQRVSDSPTWATTVQECHSSHPSSAWQAGLPPTLGHGQSTATACGQVHGSISVTTGSWSGVVHIFLSVLFIEKWVKEYKASHLKNKAT